MLDESIFVWYTCLFCQRVALTEEGCKEDVYLFSNNIRGGF